MIAEVYNFIKENRDSFEELIIKNQKLKSSFNIIISQDFRVEKSFFFSNDINSDCRFIKDFQIKERDYYLNYLDMNKTFNKKIHSVSPFGIFFKKDTPANTISEILTGDQYFHKIESFQDSETIQKIRSFSQRDLISIIEDKIYKLTGELNLWKEKQLEKCQQEESEKNKKSCQDKIEKIEIEYIRVYFNFGIEELKSFRKALFSVQLFNNSANYEKKNLISTLENYSCPISEERESLGIPNFLNSLGDKKPFLIHKTRKGKFEGFPALHSLTALENIYIFEQLLKSGTLPTPLPIFIDKAHNDLNRIEIDLISKSGEKLKFQEIIREVSKSLRVGDTLNYYLIFWKNSQSGIVLYDIDYIENFQFQINIELGDTLRGSSYFVKKESVFQLKSLFAEIMGKDRVSFFGDKFGSSYEKEITNLLYEYIYKAKKEVITEKIFSKFALYYIRDAIKKEIDESEIVRKLNIYLNLNKFFGGEDLASSIESYEKSVKDIFSGRDIESDEVFAYVSGKFIRHLLKQSESASKTHSFLEAFISKQNEKQFKDILTITFRKYSHKLEDSDKRLDNFINHIFGYSLNRDFKSLIPIIISGYFSRDLIFEPNK